MATIFQFNKPQSRIELLEKIEELKRENAKLTADKQAHANLVDSLSNRINNQLVRDYQRDQEAWQHRCDVLNKDIEGFCQDIDTMQEQIEELRQDIDTKDQQIEALLTDNQQLGLNAQVRVHELERDLEIAKQVAEYWKASAEAQQILTSIYKTLSSL